MQSDAMIQNTVLRKLPVVVQPVEIVERKGIGHPDTICDALSEKLSRNLCRWYLEHTGTVLHHNVDKALLRGGMAHAVFGGGAVDEPIDIYLAGRAIATFGDFTVPIAEMAVEGSRAWLKEHLHALDPEKDVRIHCLVRHGSADLVDLFERGTRNEIPKSNDTSFGVGYAPTSPLEQATLEAGRNLDRASGSSGYPARGEDTKIMAVRRGDDVQLTVACAMITAHVPDVAAYSAECRAVADEVKTTFGRYGFDKVNIAVNAADEPEHGSYYLTVTGTSAEAGDDGQVGRGNRANGLITPLRAMSLEAVCGKNPKNHVGKLYNVAAQQIADQIVDEIPQIEAAQCCLVSQIGQAITEPSVVDIAISTNDGSPVEDQQELIQQITSDVLSSIPSMLDNFIKGQIPLY